MQSNSPNKAETMTGDLNCGRDCHCHKAGDGVLCKAEDIGLETFLVCLERNSRECDFSIGFGNLFFCSSAIRISVAKASKE